ncbi:hypothetical protein Acsp04_30920 [Actinomadura sp. NBRC 104425]|uniref:hypothetical protein n=1 Tax=Actinomadura sp. NBRC 104425 TaxID=3032204 RepID=UPI0024A47F25|nr:hypothetical protein [Actinomadura sp. NBRC 104425]GLZ12857.1 hypothetical protein Acsp04_30920 [Actinomadura sp. NBRC 104425]
MTSLPPGPPETVASRFLVSTDEPLSADLSAVLADTGGGPAALARELHARSVLTLREHRPEAGWLACLGGASGRLERLKKARHHLLVHVRGAPDDAPRYAQAARQAARLLAAAAGGLVVDVDSCQVVHTSPTERERFVLGDQWIGVFVAGDRRLVRADTWGLHRFGLPELVARDVPLGHLLTAVNLLRVLAFRLFSRRSTGTMPGTLLVDGADLPRFWGARPAPAGRFMVRLSPATGGCHGCGSALEAAATGRGADWWDDGPGRGLPKLLSVRPVPEPDPPENALPARDPDRHP